MLSAATFTIIYCKMDKNVALCKRKSTWVVDLLLEHSHHFETKLTRINYYHSENCSQLERLKSAFEHDKSIELRVSKHLPSDFSSVILKGGKTAIFIDDFEIKLSEKGNAEALYQLASVLTSHLETYT